MRTGIDGTTGLSDTISEWEGDALDIWTRVQMGFQKLEACGAGTVGWGRLIIDRGRIVLDSGKRKA
jgi:hypothetical protein